MRKLNYALAINEGLHQMMAEDESVFVIGQGVKSPCLPDFSTGFSRTCEWTIGKSLLPNS